MSFKLCLAGRTTMWLRAGMLAGVLAGVVAVVVGGSGCKSNDPVAVTNSPPGRPANPTPADRVSDLAIGTTLTWSAVDPDGDAVTFDVYFGVDPSPPVVSSSQVFTEYATGVLDYGTTYYWKVDAIDAKDQRTSGPTWRFRTVGGVWSKVFIPPTGPLVDIHGTGSGDVFVVGVPNIIHYDGVSWREMTYAGYVSGLASVFAVSPTSVYTGGAQGELLHYDGSVWSAMPTKLDLSGVALLDLWGPGDNEVYAVGSNGTIISFGGTNWTQMASGVTSSLTGIEGTTSTVYACGAGGVRRMARRGLRMWVPMSGSPVDLNDIHVFSDSDIWVGGGNGVFHYDGGAWTVSLALGGYWCGGIWGSAPDDVFAIFSDANVYHYDGIRWKAMDAGALSFPSFMDAIWGTSGSDIFVAGHGTSGNELFHFGRP